MLLEIRHPRSAPTESAPVEHRDEGMASCSERSTVATVVARKVWEMSMFHKQSSENANPQDGAGSAADPLSQAERVELLAHIPLFSELSPKELRTLAGAAVQREYPAGTVIVREGEPGVGLYVLIRGRARVQQQMADGSPHQLALLGGNEFFGELALLDNGPRSATVVAEEDTHALVIPIVDFRALLHNEADIAIKLLSVLARRVRSAESAGK
jgi:CRP/FNR family transcriptional regulator, cyclic AMP receptor protein